jgi:hypothetical protein
MRHGSEGEINAQQHETCMLSVFHCFHKYCFLLHRTQGAPLCLESRWNVSYFSHCSIRILWKFSNRAASYLFFFSISFSSLSFIFVFFSSAFSLCLVVFLLLLFIVPSHSFVRFQFLLSPNFSLSFLFFRFLSLITVLYYFFCFPVSFLFSTLVILPLRVLLSLPLSQSIVMSLSVVDDDHDHCPSLREEVALLSKFYVDFYREGFR